MFHPLLADGVAALHLASVGVLLAGGLLAWRWPRLLWVHAPVSVAIVAVNVAGLDCPLTTLELHLRALAGEPAYTGGFIGHYLVRPVYARGITPTVEIVIYAAALVPNIVAYAGLWARRHTGDQASGATTVA